MTHAFQDYYSDDFSHCYGCGTANPHGNQLKSYWETEGETTIARFRPAPHHSAGSVHQVYGGMLASLLDCHGTGSATAFLYRDQGRTMGDDGPKIHCVTASLTVNFLKPTPMGVELVMRGKLRRLEGRKVWLDLFLSANDQVCASGEILAIALKPSE